MAGHAAGRSLITLVGSGGVARESIAALAHDIEHLPFGVICFLIEPGSLQREHGAVATTQFNQFIMCARFGDMPIFQYTNPIRLSHG